MRVREFMHTGTATRVRGKKSVRRATESSEGDRPPKQAADRTALPTSLPRPVKLTRDRTSTVPPPAHVRVLGIQVEDEDREQIARKLGMKLGKFAASIERITVRLSDANGPKGGRDQVCQIKVVISGLPSVVVEERDAAFHRALDRAISSAALAVRGRLHRRRLKPLHHRASQWTVTEPEPRSTQQAPFSVQSEGFRFGRDKSLLKRAAGVSISL